MDFAVLLATLTARLDEADRGDRAWWLLTRVHLSAFRLQQIAAYLYDAGAASGLILTPSHYANLAATLEIGAPDPAMLIKRHYFLAMDKPLQLIERTDGEHWNQISLTGTGVMLANMADSVGILESKLRDIRFCRTPWYNQQRVHEYPEFNVRPYEVVLAVMNACGGYVDVDEFDLFVSRIRDDSEVDSAIEGIRSFRPLAEEQKQKLRALVSARIPKGTGGSSLKRYNNWRDMARHTFALFSLGESAIQVDNRLLLAANLVLRATSAPQVAEGGGGSVPVASSAPAAAVAPPVVTLRIPDAEAPPELLTPPGIPQANNGAEAELLIGKIFAAAGWQVVYYNQRRGYGFDLWVRKDDQAFVVEVKSFIGQGGTIVLTANEREAAALHGENFLLAIVENAASAAPMLHVIQNPLTVLAFQPTQIAQYSVSRAVWRPIAEALEV